MRGKAEKPNSGQQKSRITPAYAGKSSAFIHSSPVNQDHPRLCGEKPQRFSECYKVVGSPPPMRGKVLEREQEKKHDRITPAYAGKRLLIPSRTDTV